MLSIVKNDPDREDQIEIKYENIIPEYIDTEEIKEESAVCEEFEIKIENCNVDEKLKDLPQEYKKDDKILNGDDLENIDCSDNKCLNISVGVYGIKDSLEHASCLKGHNSVHSGKKVHKCEYCDYGSPQKSKVKRHINSTHTRENIHKCGYCDYKSPEVSTLKRHVNSIHTREKIHKCVYCDFGSPQMSNLKRHINSTHTREKIHKCEYCDYGSPEMSTLKRHVNSIHTREKIHKCRYCDFGSPQMTHLKSHINSKHKRENTQVSVLRLWKS